MAKKKKLGLFWPCVILVLAALFYFYISGGSEESPAAKDITATPVLPGMQTESLRHNYYSLDGDQQSVYRTMETAVATGSLNVTCTLSEEAFHRTFLAFLRDHPEYFWLSGSYRYTCNRLTKKLSVTLGCYDYWTYTSTPERYIRRYNQAMEAVITEGQKITGEYEKVKFVHDKLAQTIVYDHDVVPEVNSANRSANTEQALSTYGAMVMGRTLCGGYAESFYLLCNALGVECIYLEGEAGEPHAWNCLRLGGEYYYMDVTWDDPDLGSGSKINCPEGIIYTYFCLTSREMGLTHTPDSTFPLPNATATEFNYHRREGYYFDTYRYDKAAAALEEQRSLQIISVKFADGNALAQAKADLIDGHKWQKIPCLSGRKTIRYAVDEEHFVFTFYLEAA